MNCPYCAFEGGRRQVHAHLVAEHGGQIDAEPEGDGGPAVSVACPLCSERLRVPFDPRGRPAGLREEAEGAAHMVLFDLLLYHVEASHLPD